MKGDFSRQTFRPEKHYSGVRLQQGRAHLDADWNEQVDIQAHRDATTARDVIGPVGAPFDGGGFAVSGASFLRAIDLLDADQAWAVGERGAILRTTDKGASWALQATPAGAGHLSAVQAVTASSAWAVGDGGTLLRYDGSAWNRVTVTGVTAALYGVDFFDATHGWAVGDAGTVLFWDGLGWSQRNVPQLSAALRGVHFVSASKGWAVGDGGTIIATTDGGASWTPQSPPAGTPRLRSVFFTGANAGYAVGDGGTILATADGGTTWARRSVSGVSAVLRAVRFESAGQNGWAAGHEATVVATTDGGATWVREAAIEAGLARLTGVALFGGTRLACSETVVLRRETGPTRWLPRPMPAQGRDLAISAGDLYLDGVRCENDRPVSFTSQPDLPGVLPASSVSGSELRGAYLVRREEHLTAVERDDIREVALRGPDTSTRTRVSWQVHLTGPLADDGCATLAAALPAVGGAGRLRARSEPVELAASECAVAPAGGYRRLENQLYRVEIHDPGPIAPATTNGHATYKWSRDNGSMLARLKGLDEAGLSVAVSTPGRDDVLGFAAEQWVEVTDESRLRRGLPGILLEVDQVQGNSLAVVSFPGKPGGGSWSMADFPVNPTVRRWDGQAAVPVDWKELEEGVQVEFGGGPFETGDFWTVPARTVTGAVEWPRETGVPGFRPPEGGPAAAALGVVRVHSNGNWEGVRDCRRRFSWLTALVRLLYVGGDGQEVKTNLSQPSKRAELPAPLEVGVFNGEYPVRGATVRFKCIPGTGNGRLTTDLPNPTVLGDDDILVRTGADGIARCSWELDGAVQSQRVEATLADELGGSTQAASQVPIRFNATRSVAGEIAYLPPNDCPPLTAAASVQSAIDELALQRRLHHIRGGGLEGAPGEHIELRVGIANACGAAEGRVRFERTAGDGTLQPTEPVSSTGGEASCEYTFGQAARQEVRATLVDQAGIALRTPTVTFALSLIAASQVTFDPTACAGFAGKDTVQLAMEELCDDRSEILQQLERKVNRDVEEQITGPLTVHGALTTGTSLRTAAGVAVNEFSTDGNLTDNSNSALPTERAVKTYVDKAVAAMDRRLLIQSGEVGDRELDPAGQDFLDVPVRVTFPNAFSEAPTVSVSLVALDVAEDRNLRCAVWVADVGRDGFTAVYRSWSDTRIFLINAAWVAYGRF